MRKIKSVKHDKLWGYEIWLYSPLKGMETTYENGEKNNWGPLIKILNAEQNLSIQVHPDDKLAKELEGLENGKAESWYILKANKDAEMIVGLKNYNHDFIRNALENKTFMNNLLKVKSKEGDFINIPAGAVHGVGAGNIVFEVQQPSDTTYRYYDYDRLQDGKPRELHVDKSLKSQKDVSWKLEPLNKTPLAYKTKAATQIFMKEKSNAPTRCIVIDLDKFKAFEFDENELIDLSNYVIVY